MFTIPSHRTAVICALAAVIGCHRHGAEQVSGTAIARQFDACWGYWNEASWDRLATCYAPDAVIEQPGAGLAPAKGPAAIVARATALRTALPDMRAEPLVEVVDDGHLVSVVLLHGSHRDAGVLLSQIIELGRGGRVQHVALYADLATPIDQLAPAPARPRTRVAIATGDERERVNASVVPQLICLLNRHDLAGLDAVLDDDVVWSAAAAALPRDRAGLRRALVQLWKAVPDVRFRATSLYRAGAYVAIAGSVEGTHVRVPYDAVFQLEGGKIVRGWVFVQRTAVAHARTDRRVLANPTP